jgi:hypothetical protein
MGAIRNRDVYLCPLGAMAQYFFWRWHYSSKIPPSFIDQCSWYRKKLLVGSTNTTKQEISYNTQLDHVNTSFNIIGIESVTKTQAIRGYSARSIELYGIG